MKYILHSINMNHLWVFLYGKVKNTFFYSIIPHLRQKMLERFWAFFENTPSRSKFETWFGGNDASMEQYCLVESFTVRQAYHQRYFSFNTADFTHFRCSNKYWQKLQFSEQTRSLCSLFDLHNILLNIYLINTRFLDQFGAIKCPEENMSFATGDDLVIEGWMELSCQNRILGTL